MFQGQIHEDHIASQYNPTWKVDKPNAEELNVAATVVWTVAVPGISKRIIAHVQFHLGLTLIKIMGLTSSGRRKKLRD